MADIFISYKSQERDHAKRLAGALEKLGLSVWWDRELMTGDQYRKVIEKELNASRVVIVIWSAHAVGSEWVLDEADVARSHRKLLPVKFDKNFQDIPIGFRSIHVQDLSAWSGDTSSREIREIEHKVDSIMNDKFVEALVGIGSGASKGEAPAQDALRILRHLNTSVGGMPIPRFLVGSLGLSILLTAVAASGAALMGAQPIETIMVMPVAWIYLMIVRAGHQFVMLAKLKSARHFFDPSFAFALTISIQIALILYALYVILGGVFSLGDLLLVTPVFSTLSLSVIVFFRALLTGFLFLIRRAR